MKIRAIIAEDERLAREELAYLIGLQPDFVLCPSAEDGEQLLELLQAYRPDVLFLDIEMPGMSGIDIARKLAQSPEASLHQSPFIVFTTAYDEYALPAFAIDALDYLLKPYDSARLDITLERIRRRFQDLPLREEDVLKSGERSTQLATRFTPSSHDIPPNWNGGKGKASKILIDCGDRMAMVAPDAILYALRNDRHVDIHTVNEVLPFRGSLAELEEKLPGWPFFRTHRSCLVNLDAVREITPWFNGAYTVVIENKERTHIPVSRSAAKELFQLLSK